jgi:branched-chain amino acid transport system ATP-binding protein
MQLKLKNVTVHYGTAQAVRNVNAEVVEGSVTSFIGANGAGKSTIMRAISGLVRVSSGEIWFEDKRIDRLATNRIVQLGVIQVPEGRKLFPYMSVMANLRLGAYLRKDKEGIIRDLEEVFKLFPQLEERGNQQAGTLSGGEQQMLAIGRGLMSKPKLLLLDEPSLGLSPILVAEIAQAIKNINERGISVLLVEQNAGLVTQVTERCYVMEVGQVVLEGNIKELMSNKLVQQAFLGA